MKLIDWLTQQYTADLYVALLTAWATTHAPRRTAALNTAANYADRLRRLEEVRA